MSHAVFAHIMYSMHFVTITSGQWLHLNTISCRLKLRLERLEQAGLHGDSTTHDVTFEDIPQKIPRSPALRKSSSGR